ncbi:50S ribosomal protein L25 [bacterium (Candidatus Howlettbacteria) CG_4_10_14_0_8_um_filter_40_9]|nr:MAG: 50S ribosomal protein L25 [bacterium (Candidatus Howlettbacteria) CG_4_10_14_0_8_um_filter_40_9]
MNVAVKPALAAQKREITGKKVSSLRRNGLIPAVIYGKNIDSVNISMNIAEFNKIYKDAGGNTIVLVKIEGENDKNVLIHRVDKDGVSGYVIHADLYEVKMTEKITAKVPLNFTGDSKAVREMDGMLITNKNEVEVECLPGDLIHDIEVNIETLDDFEKAIHISDLKVPQGVVVLDEPEETVATVEPPRSEEEMAELEEVVEEVIPEVEGEKAAEGEGAAEGEEAPQGESEKRE